MQSKSNRVISLAMSAALMLTNMIAPMKVYADDAMDTYVEYGEEDSDHGNYGHGQKGQLPVRNEHDYDRSADIYGEGYGIVDLP